MLSVGVEILEKKKLVHLEFQRLFPFTNVTSFATLTFTFHDLVDAHLISHYL